MHELSLHVETLPGWLFDKQTTLGFPDFSYACSRPSEEVLFVPGLTLWLRETGSYGHAGEDLEKLLHDRTLHQRTVDQIVLIDPYNTRQLAPDVLDFLRLGFAPEGFNMPLMYDLLSPVNTYRTVCFEEVR